LDEVRTTQEKVRKYVGAVQAVERTLAFEEGDRA
jgi:hypothetical protein